MITSRRPRVFFPCESTRFKYEDASGFGDVVSIIRSTDTYNGGYNPYLEDELIHGLEVAEFSPAIDLIALVGPVPYPHLLLATAVLRFGEVRTLIFDRSKDTYYVRPFYVRQSSQVKA